MAAVTCALAPAYTIRWHYGPLPTTLLETGVLLTVAVFIIESFQQRLRPSWRTPFTWPALLFLGAGAISVLIAPDHRAALGLYRAYIVEPLAFFIALAAVVRGWDQARLVLAGLAIAAVLVCIPNAFVVLQAARHHSLNLAVATPVVIFQTPNALALFTMPLIAIGGSLLLYGQRRLDRIASGLFLAVAVPATLLSFSRGGFLALAVVIFVLALTHPRRSWLVPIALIAAVAVSRIPPIASRIGHEVNLADPNNTLDSRLRLWAATLRMLREHPIFGAGLSGFKQTVAGYRNGVYNENLIYPHNIVLNFWTETGLLGVAAFGWILVQAARVAWNGWVRGPAGWRPYQLGVLIALIAVVVHGMVDVPYWKNDLSLEFWVILALSWAGGQARESPIG